MSIKRFFLIKISLKLSIKKYYEKLKVNCIDLIQHIFEAEKHYQISLTTSYRNLFKFSY
jgi:hypothetical protein